MHDDDDVNLVPAGAGPRALSTLLEFREVRRHRWFPDELDAMLRHQLDAPLHLGLGTFSGEAAHLLRRSDPQHDPMLTLRQLLCDESPSLELLRLVKRFAKSCRSDPDHPLPGEIVMLLYYTSIAAALVRAGESISDLPPTALLRGVRWISKRTWVSPDVGALLRDAGRVLDAAVGRCAAVPGEMSPLS